MSSTSEYENENGETIVHWSKQDNPFFAQMPVVHIARAVRKLGDDEITTPDTECQRVFSRVRNHRVDMNVMNGPDLLSQKGSLAQSHSFYELLPFDVVFFDDTLVQRWRFDSPPNPPGVSFDSERTTFTTGPGASGNWWKAWSNTGHKPMDGGRYFEVVVPTISSAGVAIGVMPESTNPDGGNAGDNGRIQYFSDGRKRRDGVYEAYGSPYISGSIIGVGIGPNGIEFFLNGVSQGVAYNIPGANLYLPHFCIYANTLNDKAEISISPTIQHLPSGYKPWF